MHHSLGILAAWKINLIIILHEFLRSKQHKKASHFLHLKNCKEVSLCIQEVRRTRKENPIHTTNLLTVWIIKLWEKQDLCQQLLSGMNGHCKLWWSKLSCGFNWRYQVRMYWIPNIYDYIQNTQNYNYNPSSFKGHLWGWLTNQRRRRTKEGNTDLKLFLPFLMWIMQRIINLLHHWFFSLSSTADQSSACLFC